MNFSATAFASWASGPQRRSVLRLAGIVFDRIWVYLLFFSVTPFGGTDSVSLLYSNMFASLCSLAATFAIAGMTARRARTFVLSKYCIGAAAVLMSLGTLALGVVGQHSQADRVLGLASAVMTGVGSAALFLGWTRILFRLDADTMAREYSLATVISLACSVALSFFPHALVFALVCALPVASGLLRSCAFVRIDAAANRPAEAAETADERQPRTLCGIAVFGLVAGAANVLCSESVYAPSSFFTSWLLVGGLAICAVACVLYCRDFELGSHMTHRLEFFSMAAGCLLFAVLGEGNIPSSMLVHAGFTCFTMTLVINAITRAQVLRRNALKLVCRSLSMLYVGELAGLVFGFFTETALGPQAPILQWVGFVLAIAVLAGYLFLFTERDVENALIDTNDLTPSAAATKQEAGQQAPDPLAMLESTCADIAATFSLSPREAEILPLLIRGRTNTRIQEELSISLSTVNTHTRHIYHKCGVLDKQELLDLYETWDSKSNDHATLPEQKLQSQQKDAIGPMEQQRRN